MPVLPTLMTAVLIGFGDNGSYVTINDVRPLSDLAVYIARMAVEGAIINTAEVTAITIYVLANIDARHSLAA